MLRENPVIRRQVHVSIHVQELNVKRTKSVLMARAYKIRAKSAAVKKGDAVSSVTAFPIHVQV